MELKSVNTKKHTWLNDTALAVLLAWAGAIGSIGVVAPGTTALSEYDGMIRTGTVTYTNSFFVFLFFAINLYVLKRILPVFKELDRYRKICTFIFSGCLSVALHFGARLESVDNVNFKDISLYLYIICFALYLCPVIYALWYGAGEWSKNHLLENQKQEASLISSKTELTLLKVWGMIFVLWIPTFLAFFPGAFVYDATDEYVEVISRQFTMHHPLFHVLMLGGIVHGAEYLGLGANAGIAVYTLIQMVLFSGVIAYLLMFLKERGIKKGYLLFSVLFFGVFPLFPMYAVCSAKDTLFTAAFLMVIVLLLELVVSKEAFWKRKYILFLISSVAMMLMRNNGMYAYAVAIPVIAGSLLLMKFEKKSVIRLAALMVLAIVLYMGSNYCLKIACHASDNEHQEMLTVPIQQIARVYKYSPETFSEEEAECLYEVLPENYLKTYTARCSDILKSGFDNNAYAKNPARYRKLWWDIFKRKPYIYVNAWLVNSYGYWYPDMIINVYGGIPRYTFSYENSSYFGFETEPPGERNSLFPLYEEFYRKISLEIFQQKVPVISMFFSPGFLFIVFAWCVMGFLMEKQLKMFAVFSPVLLLWGTVLMGPTVLVRYMLILWCIVPLLPYAINQTIAKKE